MNSKYIGKDHEIIKLIESVEKRLDIISKHFSWLSSLDDDRKFKMGFLVIGYQFSELVSLFRENKLKLV